MTEMPSLKLPISTLRLQIRDAVRSDMHGWSALYRSPKVRQYMGGPLKRTAKAWWSGHQDCINKPDRPLTIVFSQTNEFVGVCGLFMPSPLRDNKMEIWLLLRNKFWGNGIGSEVTLALINMANSTLGAKHIIGIVDPRNRKSLDMLTKLGFTFIGEYNDGRAWQQGHHIYEYTISE